MELHEQAFVLHPEWVQDLGAHREDIIRFALSYAEGMAEDPDADRGKISKDLRAILDRLADARQALEELTDREDPAAAFADFGAPALSAEYINQLQEERHRVETEIRAKGRALGFLFRSICRALGHYGITFTGQELRKIREGRELTAKQAEALNALHRTKTPTLPADYRLDAEDTAALYLGLTQEGLISGSLAAFAYHLGPLSNGRPIGENSPISWTGKPTLFAYFVRRITDIADAKRKARDARAEDAKNRTTALCRAFGIDEKQQSTIETSLVRNEAPRDRARIDKILLALPGFCEK